MNSIPKNKSVPPPNALNRGRVTRTMCPPAPGTQRWLKQFGAQALLCVRHREDPAGLRRVVTVELVVAEVRARTGQRRLVAQRLYPVRVDVQALTQRRAVKAAGGRWDAAQGLWYLSGAAVRTLGLIDQIAIDRQPKRRASGAA